MYMCTIIFYPTADEDVPIFYDAVEDVEELSSDEEAASKSSTDPRIIVLRTKLSTITRKRAKIRNGKVSSEATVAKKKLLNHVNLWLLFRTRKPCIDDSLKSQIHLSIMLFSVTMTSIILWNFSILYFLISLYLLVVIF